MPKQRNFTPPRPTSDGPLGNGPALAFFQWVYDSLQILRNPIDTPTSKITMTTRGWSVASQAQRGGTPGEAEPQNWFLGEYDPLRQYSPQEEVVLSGVCSAICIATPPLGTSPDTGAPYWFVRPNFPPGVWAFPTA